MYFARRIGMKSSKNERERQRAEANACGPFPDHDADFIGQRTQGRLAGLQRVSMVSLANSRSAERPLRLSSLIHINKWIDARA